MIFLLFALVAVIAVISPVWDYKSHRVYCWLGTVVNTQFND